MSFLLRREIHPTPLSELDFDDYGEEEEEEEEDDELLEDLSSRRRRRRSRRVKREDVSDAISRNITRILEGLLKNYDKTERPAFRTGECSRICLGVRPYKNNYFLIYMQAGRRRSPSTS